jgi:hypothetical protein
MAVIVAALVPLLLPLAAAPASKVGGVVNCQGCCHGRIVLFGFLS